MIEAHETEDFWDDAPVLLDVLQNIVSELGQSGEVAAELEERVGQIADLIPETPEPLRLMDPYLRDALLTAVVHAQRAVDTARRRELLIALERARQAVRDLLDERPVWVGGPKHAVRWLVDEAQLPKSVVEELLDFSPTTLRRWLDPEDETEPSPEAADRAQVVAKIVNHLRHAMTARGVAIWMMEPHPDLDDRAPVTELKDPASYHHLVRLASGSRSVGAT